MTIFSRFVAIVLAVAAATQAPPSQTRAHVEALASDRFEGRFTGSNGERLAAEYIATELRKIGALPIPTQTGYFLPFEFTAGTRDGGSTIELRGTTTGSTAEAPGTVRALSF